MPNGETKGWRKPVLFALGLSLSLTVAGAQAVAADTGQAEYVIGTAAAAPYKYDGRPGYLDILYDRWFSRIGRKASVIALPAERALRNANHGIEDGDAMRVGGLEEAYPNLLRVPEPMMSMEFVAFAMDPAVKITRWSDLKNYVAGGITGWKIVEKKAAIAKKLTMVGNPKQLFELLGAGRADAVIFERWQGLALMRDLRRRKAIESVARVQEPPLARAPMFLYLHKKHAALVPALADALKAMKDDGSFARVARETLEPLLE